MSLHFAEEILISAVEWQRLAVEITGAAIIGVGLLVVILKIIQSLVTMGRLDFTRLHITFAR